MHTYHFYGYVNQNIALVFEKNKVRKVHKSAIGVSFHCFNFSLKTNSCKSGHINFVTKNNSNATTTDGLTIPAAHDI